MKYYVEETLLDEKDVKTAGGKAREDVATILDKAGYKKLAVKAGVIERGNLKLLYRLIYHYKLKKVWQQTFTGLSEGDEVIIQFPLLSHTLFFSQVIKDLRKRRIKVIFLIHDLESLRWSQLEKMPFKSKIRLNIEEKSVLEKADKIVSHNSKMSYYLQRYSIRNVIVIPLEIFDYLIPSFDTQRVSDTISYKMPVIIAGNLSKHKAGYIYHLPENVEFNLYGIGYEESKSVNNYYHGSFLPNDLPFVLQGSFGLVWDGPSPDSCTGAYGEYLRVNNPHKTSLYLASGIPVVIWGEAAMADFVRKNHCGIVVSTLKELGTTMDSISEENYAVMKRNAEKIGSQLRKGYFTKKALGIC